MEADCGNQAEPKRSSDLGSAVQWRGIPVGVDTSRNDLRSRLLALSRGFMAPRIFLTAVELGVFVHLDNGPKTASEMARQLNADERAVDILLHALAALGLLEKKGGAFSNIQEVANLLVRSERTGEGGGFLHAVRLWDAWSRLTEVVKTGTSCSLAWQDELSEDFAVAMNHYAKGSAERLARLTDCSNASTMLDLGGGGGSYGIAFATQYPHLKVVLFENSEQALRVTGKLIEQANMRDRIELRRGDFFVDDFGGDYDLALLASIVCLFGKEENVALFERVKRSLREGGRIVIKDSMVDESGTGPASAAVFAVHMLVTSRKGRSHSWREVKGWLRQVGFEDVHSISLDSSRLVVGRT